MDEALAILTREPPGARDPGGPIPPASVNGRIERELAAMAEAARFERTVAEREGEAR